LKDREIVRHALNGSGVDDMGAIACGASDLTRQRLSTRRLRQLLARSGQLKITVIGDVMLDEFVWGDVSRISPEAPVPVVDVVRETAMPGGAANVAKNLAALGVETKLCGVVGDDGASRTLVRLVSGDGIDCAGLVRVEGRGTSVKTRIVAQNQQVVRVDRETCGDIDRKTAGQLVDCLQPNRNDIAAMIVCDYGKGVVTQFLLDEVKEYCRARGIWLSLDPKPLRHLDLTGLSLITPNRKEAFELAGVPDPSRHRSPVKPMEDTSLLELAANLRQILGPRLLLITLGSEGMLLCEPGKDPFHVRTAAREVFDVSGAGDTVVASFTMAIAAGASPTEATCLANHAAGIVVGKVGTAVVTRDEMLANFPADT
jgi:D-beta-D-heptose 7-phosphate kinase/D-beta-D-heptose 1-phosphate adenosyltransferase